MTVSYSSDYNYANAKLAGSLVRFGLTPVIVNEVDVDDGEVSFSYIGGNHNHCHLDQLDLEPVPLGYVNHPQGCSYACRIPARHWRQGLRDGLINVKGRTAIRVSITSRALVNTILGVYPSLSSCFDALANGEATERAFSRDFAIGTTRGRRMRLIYQGDDVGNVGFSEGAYTTTFNPQHEYLQELYQEQVNEQ